MVAYNERIVATSASQQRIHRAQRMLVNLRPLIARLEASSVTTVPVAARLPSHAEYDVVWRPDRDAPSLTGPAAGLGSTLAGHNFKVHR